MPSGSRVMPSGTGSRWATERISRTLAHVSRSRTATAITKSKSRNSGNPPPPMVDVPSVGTVKAISADPMTPRTAMIAEQTQSASTTTFALIATKEFMISLFLSNLATESCTVPSNGTGFTWQNRPFVALPRNTTLQAPIHWAKPMGKINVPQHFG